MEIQLNVRITETKTSIEMSNNYGTITIIENSGNIALDQPAVYILLKDNTVISIGKSETGTFQNELDFNKIITIAPSWDIELDYLMQQLTTDAIENGIQLIAPSQLETKIPASYQKTVTTYKDEVLFILEKFGYPLKQKEEPKKEKAKPAKARHKWTKEVSQIEFFIDTRDSKATALWHKRNEMLLKAGATIMANPPLNKDGSLGFSAKMGQRIREDHKDKVKNNRTTEDIILKSVNEVGLFLYFGGTNSWLELIDANGKTLNEWTVV
ncbi:hypothetical protein UAY_00059 [Enterococcus moraviensis ATCC BAA-383]|uniref:Uncharacterized protein n=1 Tax=Enterococcus moraviensis ATCC BAA-383 TaxID=1158609 RepID=R2U1Z7_9ENTE|nr:hypothetical protein [Enterococcus moraviensis]EOI06717.1 hypothetical protein UAY_00059 [Enterococcus moraviensis ATCC BAA-383]EOT65054.1 hypothetical protein I586_02788 [Enterococcus moraviensis ATCC BAA-383]OJG66900.1 hypothetical protein RV09_GL003117 [Enterococcus moraviensis]